EVCGIFRPRRMVRPDQFAPRFDSLARYQILEAQDASPQPLSRLNNRHVVPGSMKFMRGAQSAQSGTDYHDPLAVPARCATCSRESTKKKPGGPGGGRLELLAGREAFSSRLKPPLQYAIQFEGHCLLPRNRVCTAEVNRSQPGCKSGN